MTYTCKTIAPVDFDEELSGFFGGALYAETAYVRRCLEHIYSLYPKRARVCATDRGACLVSMATRFRYK